MRHYIFRASEHRALQHVLYLIISGYMNRENYADLRKLEIELDDLMRDAPTDAGIYWGRLVGLTAGSYALLLYEVGRVSSNYPKNAAYLAYFDTAAAAFCLIASYLGEKSLISDAKERRIKELDNDIKMLKGMPSFDETQYNIATAATP